MVRKRSLSVAGLNLRNFRWKTLTAMALVALTWWFYAAPANVAKRLRGAVEQAEDGAAPALVSARVDFARVNPALTGDLHSTVNGKLDADSFSHLLLHGWLPQQRPNAAADEPLPVGVPAQARQTRIYLVRYRDWNRVIATFWDANHFRQIILTLERSNLFHPWKVTRVAQFNMCPHDFDCAHVLLSDVLPKNAPGTRSAGAADEPGAPPTH